MNLQDVAVAVIGSGPAGMAAAIRAKEKGAKNVVILERAEELGGLLHQCVHNGFGMFYFQQDLTGPEYAHRFIEKTMDVGVQPLLETMALGISPDREITAVNTRQKLLKFTPKSIVLAMGCRKKAVARWAFREQGLPESLPREPRRGLLMSRAFFRADGSSFWVQETSA